MEELRGVTSFAPGPFEEEPSTYYVIAGDFVNSVRFDAALTARIDKLFLSVRNADDIDIQAIQGLIHAGAAIAVRIEKNKLKAKKLRGKFEEYFGLPKTE